MNSSFQIIPYLDDVSQYGAQVTYISSSVMLRLNMDAVMYEQLLLPHSFFVYVLQ